MPHAMSYARDFSIGKQEMVAFYLLLDLSAWGKGILAFGAVGALTALLYTTDAAVPLRVGATIGTAAAGALLTVLWRIAATILRVNGQMSRAGRKSYVQRVEINGFGIQVNADGKKARAPFDRIQKVQETRGAFYVYLAPAQAWILPKKQMENPVEESETLREIFRKVIPSGQLRLKK